MPRGDRRITPAVSGGLVPRHSPRRGIYPAGAGAVASASQVTVNDLPSGAARLGGAVPAGVAEPGRGTSRSGTALQVGAVSVPATRLPTAAIREKVTAPKSARGSGRQDAAQSDGASAIHSAELRSSGPAGVTRSVTSALRVRFRSWRTRPVPTTLTDAVTRSPGRTGSASFTLGPGTSSYQAS